ncbi:MAG: hypothetical protein IPM82_15990 [Saprospiraceae bacterium]|nr:hypothetical protein [Saprospiraceae bacterium]
MSAFQSLQEINSQAIAILCKEIGIANTLRFIRQFSNGHGNYTEERGTFLKEKSLEGIMAEIIQNRKVKKAS